MMHPADLDAADPTFVADLLKSQDAVWQVARWIAEHWHLDVMVPPLDIRPTAGRRFEFSDRGDLHLVIPAEVKHLRRAFTCREDFPWPTVIVERVHRWDFANPKPVCYFLLNDVRTHAILIEPKHTFRYWSRVTCQSRGREREFYRCPIQYVQFLDLRKDG